VLPDGQIEAQLPQNESAVCVNEVDLNREFPDPSGAFRDEALGGKLHSGQCVEDERSKDRTCH
jgi:hypothetical protein